MKRVNARKKPATATWTRAGAGFALAAGAGLGIAAMYLLDPQAGARRRRMIAGRVRETVSDAATRAMGTGGEMLDSARQIVHEAGHQKLADLTHRANIAMGREHEHHYVGQSVCALSSMAMGAGVMWALDPHEGKARRAWLLERGSNLLRETGEFFALGGKYIFGRFFGETESDDDFGGDMPSAPEDSAAPTETSTPHEAGAQA